MLVFRRHGFRRSSIEQAAEAAGLTRQALYHHFNSKEALFRAVIERVHENALAAEHRGADAAEKAGGSLADILIAEIAARLKQFIASFDGSPHVEELFSEHLLQARDLYQKYAALYAAQRAATIERVCRRQTPRARSRHDRARLARCIEMAINGTKSALSRRCSRPTPSSAISRSWCERWSPAPSVRRRSRATARSRREEIRPPKIWRSQMSTMTINGRLAPLPDDPDALLIDVIRDDLGLTGTKLVCGAGVCGACTVLVDGAPVASCLMPARAAADKIGDDGRRHRREQAAPGAEGLHGARRAAMRVLHAGLRRRGRGVSRPLARGEGNGDAVARGNRRGAVGPSVPLRRL